MSHHEARKESDYWKPRTKRILDFLKSVIRYNLVSGAQSNLRQILTKQTGFLMFYAIKHYFYVMTDIKVAIWCQL